ncbi:MAG: carbohydrate kinase [Alphaproteobacteria bacterium]|nr:carbohydrate kinase [Alphaproteobacteria bacterium]
MADKLNAPVVVGLGEVVFDILPDCRKLGGAPADFLHHAVMGGVSGYLVSAIGADDLGREVISELQKFEINPVLAITPYPTGRVLIINTPSGGRSAHILENAAWDYIPLTTAAEECIKKADAIYFGTLALRKAYSKTTMLELIDMAPSTAYRFFDVNFRQNYYDAGLVLSLLERADILKLNTDELKVIKTLLKLSGNVEDICLSLKEKYGLKYLILSDGTKETRIWGKDGLTSVKNSRLHQAFAFGAGNAFGGTFMAALLQNATQEEAHLKANAAAAAVCKASRNK